MTDVRFTVELLPVQCAAALLITAAVAYFLGRRLNAWPAVLLAGFAVPTVIVGQGLYYAATIDTEDGTRGKLLIVTLGLAAATSLVTLIVSRLADSLDRQ